MGQAKQRGSFEKRKEEGEARLAAERQTRADIIAAYENSLSPEQRKKRASTQTLLMALDALTSGSINIKD